jgi:hypothetical protein
LRICGGSGGDSCGGSDAAAAMSVAHVLTFSMIVTKKSLSEVIFKITLQKHCFVHRKTATTASISQCTK